jgi:hypothetical protein
MADTIATWSISLNCDCPACNEYVDLLNYADFWDGRRIDVPEHGTARTKNVEVVCPECSHDFTVELEY